jgi:Holliday junction DNA helicase RuvB
VQTVLLSIMTDFAVSFLDEAGETVHVDLPVFTLIGATTQAGELLKPFLNRFAVIELEDYTEEEKDILVRGKLKKLGYEATDAAIADISRRCRGVPRTIETFVRGVIDMALMMDVKVITEEMTAEYFDMREIDDLGLNKNDRRLLEILDEAARPMALVTMESKSGIQREDLEYRYEPYLIKLGFVEKTERGRVITAKGRLYLHPENAPADPPAEAPAEEPAEAPAEAPAEVPAEAPVEAPAEAPVEAPVEAPELPELPEIFDLPELPGEAGTEPPKPEGGEA